MADQEEIDNLSVFQDSLSTELIKRLAPSSSKTKRKGKGRKNEIKPVHLDTGVEYDASDISDFIEYLAEEMFASLPPELRTLSYAKIQDDPRLGEKYSLPLDPPILDEVIKTVPPSTTDSLLSYSLLADPIDLDRFLDPILTTYITATTSAPPEHTPALTASRPAGCEICDREHLPLTYHHLIPRQMHAKAVKRGWHREWELNKVAWLCRACHSYVHGVASNEELARSFYDVGLLLEREDVRRFAAWVGRVRWKAR